MTRSVIFEKFVQYIHQIGAADVEHSGVGYLGHAVGVYRDLKTWDCSEDVCNAGLFHSIYGTELFQGFTLPLEKRDEVKLLIGKYAEWLAYLNCAIVYSSFDSIVARGSPPYVMEDRFTGDLIEIKPDDFSDLCTIHLCDRLEQFPRSPDLGFRPKVFQYLAKRLGGVARREYMRVIERQDDNVTIPKGTTDTS